MKDFFYKDSEMTISIEIERQKIFNVAIATPYYTNKFSTDSALLCVVKARNAFEATGMSVPIKNIQKRRSEFLSIFKNITKLSLYL